jgi:hypothetical protein
LGEKLNIDLTSKIMADVFGGDEMDRPHNCNTTTLYVRMGNAFTMEVATGV